MRKKKDKLTYFSIGYIMESVHYCCNTDNGSSFRTRVSLCCYWTRHFVSLSFLTPHWMPGFDREQEGRPPPSCAWEKKSPPEVSINQREVRGTEREKGRRGVEGRRDAQSDKPHQNYPSSRLDLMRSQDDSVCLQKFDAAFLVTVGITLDTW